MLEEVLARVGEGICVLNKEGEFLFINERAHSIFSEPNPTFNAEITRAIHSTSPLRFEHFHPTLRRWFEHHTYPTTGGGVTVLSREITSRHRLEEALRAAEQRFRQLIDANIVGVIVVGEEFITEANESFLRMVGYTSEDVIKRRLRWREMTPPEFDNLEAHARKEYLDYGVFSSFEREFIHKDGSRVPATLSGIVIQREPLERLCLVLDLSEMKRAEARMRRIIEASKILESSLEHEKTFTQLAGFIVESGCDACEILVQEDGRLRRIVSAGTPGSKAGLNNPLPPAAALPLFKGETIVPLEQGDSARSAPEVIVNEPYSQVAVPIVARGETAGTLVVTVNKPNAFNKDDIEMYEDLGRRAGMALQHARLYDEAQRMNRLKDEFVAIVSHELRTPLTPILGGAYMLRSERQDDQTFERALGLIERNAKAQAKIVDDLLDVSRIISGKLRLNMESVDLARVVRAAADTVRPASDAKRIRIDLRLKPLNAVLSGDAGRLQQVVWNLLANSVKFTPAGGVITVDVIETSSNAELRVSDTGIGIEPDFLPYVFDRFRQANTSRTRHHGGLGLGLAIVRHLVESHGGTVDVESRADEKGSTFIVRLPVRSVAQTAKA